MNDALSPMDSARADQLAVALFAFRRPRHTATVLRSLRQAASDRRVLLYAFVDAAVDAGDDDRIDSVCEAIKGFAEFGEIHLCRRKRHMGCAANTIDGVTRVLQAHDRVVVIEDDLELAPGFLDYLSAALDCYRQRADIFSISAFSPPVPSLIAAQADVGDVYLSRRNYSTGWATWRDRWEQIDWCVSDFDRFLADRASRRAFDLGGNDLSEMLGKQMAGDIDSWSIRFSYAHFRHNAWSLCPRFSYVRHHGDDGSGTHTRRGDAVPIDLSRARPAPVLPLGLGPDTAILEQLKWWHDEPRWSRGIRRLPGVATLVASVKQWLGIDGSLLASRKR